MDEKNENMALSDLNCEQKQGLAVWTQNLCLSVGRIPKAINVLQDFNITVPVGVIYGILGPSGCGKTSLLKCIVGITKPMSGEVKIYGYTPGTIESGVPGSGVGYMPQDIALQNNLTIEEILIYFGQLYFVDSQFIAKQTDYLVTSLDLPEKTRLIGDLSEGQKRRVSYACALVHNPRLVILDEPTVGVDPILRERIWQHLISLTKNNITVIVTTHYIEEMRRANTVGFMENGRLSIAGSPQELMSTLNVTTLEEVFYRVSGEQKKLLLKLTEKNEEENEIYKNCEKQPYFKKSLPMMYFIVAWFTNLFTIVDKLFTQMKRSPQDLIALFVLPTISVMAFCVCVGESPHDIHVAIVNHENPANFSEIFVDSLPTYVVKWKYYSDLKEAFHTVKRRNSFAVIEIRENFTKGIVQRLDVHNYKKIDVNFTVEQSTIKIYADVTHKPLFVTMERVFEQTLLLFMQRIAAKGGHNPRLVSIPIEEKEILYGRHIEGDFAGWRDFETSGILILLCYVFGVAIQILSFLFEKQDKIYDRAFVAGVTPPQLLFAHLIGRTLPMFVTVSIMLMVSIFLFALPCNGSLFWAFSLLMLQSISGLANGLFLSSIMSNVMNCAFVTNGILMLLLIIGGILWPSEGLPYWIRWASALCPIAAPVESLRSILLRGWSIDHSIVALGFGMSIGWIILLMTLSIIIFHFSK